MTDFVKLGGVWVDLDAVPWIDRMTGRITPPEPRTPPPPKKRTVLGTIAEEQP
jgi:hypothetical protein